MLRIDPAARPLWRTPDAVQFGEDPVLAVLDPVPPGGEQVIAALVRGTDRAGLDRAAEAAGLDPVPLEALLVAVAPALATARTPPASRPAVALEAPPDLAPALADLLRLRPVPGEPDLVLIAAHHLVPPAATVRHLREDRPHLAVVFGDQAALVGPLVVPGRTSCLRCAEEHRLEDPHRRAVGAQLLRRSRSRTAADPGVRLRATLLLADALDRFHRGLPTGLEDAALRLAPDGSVSAQRRPRHARCSCRWPGPPA